MTTQSKPTNSIRAFKTFIHNFGGKYVSSTATEHVFRGHVTARELQKAGVDVTPSTNPNALPGTYIAKR